ncbi:hypothetical protein MKX01_008309 [Papaver californicum]|nr:hypothetical protein MKX01_008309 [Papaver californicum]
MLVLIILCLWCRCFSKIIPLPRIKSKSKHVLIHYNGKWVKKGCNDDYDGTIQPANKAIGCIGFLHVPAFDVYGLVRIPATGFTKRVIITGEEALQVYVVRRRLIAVGEDLAPAKKLPQLHDASSTPEPESTSSPPPTSNKFKYDNLVCGNFFKTKQELQLILKIASIKGSFKYKAQTSNGRVLHVKCFDLTCSCCDKSKNKTDPKFRIKGIASAMAKLLDTNFGKCDSLYTPNEFRDDMRTQYGITISYKHGYTGCKRGFEMIRGPTDESYQHLVGYSYMLEQHNPGTITTIEMDEDNSFLYYFMALGLCLEGFKNFLRMASSIDSTHLTGERKGALLSAIGLDAC